MHDNLTLQKEAKKTLEELKDKSLTNRDRLAIPQQDMPAQNPGARILNLEEVTLGYTDEQAIVESMRCLQCKTAPCIKGCPVAIDIPKLLIMQQKVIFPDQLRY